MKMLLSKLNQWKTALIKFLFLGPKKKNPKVESKNQWNSSIDQNTDDKWVEQTYIVPDEFYVTQTGQLIRQPVTRKKYYKARYKSRKRTK